MWMGRGKKEYGPLGTPSKEVGKKKGKEFGYNIYSQKKKIQQIAQHPRKKPQKKSVKMGGGE